MRKPFSKLQRDLYKLLDDSINIQIHCRAYRMPKSVSHDPQIPRYWVTLGKDIIFDYPKCAELEDKYKMYEHIPDISQSIRDYINTPLDELVDKEFPDDKFKITDILKAADRRIGKRQFEKLPQTEPVLKVLAARS